jgi:biopolymer transport protein ExbB/TolQ
VTVENIIFDVAEALRYPVLILALAALVVVLFEVGRLFVESRRRRRRGMPRLDRALDIAREALAAKDTDKALQAVRGLGYNQAMSDALGSIVEQGGYPDADDRIAKRMAEYDYRSMKRLERTRILVRAGPALGLMGTLIPLSPALASLADGDVTGLTRDLRVAFSVTVAGLLIGMIAFAVSLVRDRLYAQDFSDVEYAQSALAGKVPPVAAPAPAQADGAKPPQAAQPADTARTVVVTTTPSAATPVEPPPQQPQPPAEPPQAQPAPPAQPPQYAQPAATPPQVPPAPPTQPPVPPQSPAPTQAPFPPSAPAGSPADGLPATPEGTETRKEP